MKFSGKIGMGQWTND